MSSREAILKAIAIHKPENQAIPPINIPVVEAKNLSLQYQASIQTNGGKCVTIQHTDEINAYLSKHFYDNSIVASLTEGIKGNLDITKIANPHELEKIDVAIVNSYLGVAENAATWLPENLLFHRVLPFIAQHLIIVLSEKDLVSTMHEAYAKINIRNDGYGVFIAGPSKTADIEQSLVIGAHGPRSLTVFLNK